MKTKFFYFALTVIFSLTSISATAGGTKGKKQSSIAKHVVISHVINSFKETEMELESWMTSTNEFSTISEVSIDEPLQFEEWMLKKFSEKNDTKNFQDDELILEDWMLESFDSKNQEIFTDEELGF
jgi:hypothetical protein